MTHTRKNLKIYVSNFIVKTGRTLVADLVYVIVHQLKSVCRTPTMGHSFKRNKTSIQQQPYIPISVYNIPK